MALDERKSAELAEEASPKSPPQQRSILRPLGRFAAITPPAVTLLLSVVSKPAAGTTSGFSSRQFKVPVPIPQLRKEPERTLSNASR